MLTVAIAIIMVVASLSSLGCALRRTESRFGDGWIENYDGTVVWRGTIRCEVDPREGAVDYIGDYNYEVANVEYLVGDERQLGPGIIGGIQLPHGSSEAQLLIGWGRFQPSMVPDVIYTGPAPIEVDLVGLSDDGTSGTAITRRYGLKLHWTCPLMPPPSPAPAASAG